MYVVDLTNETWTLISKQAIILFSHRSWCGSSHPGFEAGGNSFPVAKSNSIWLKLSSFKQTKAAHNDQCCHYGQLIWSGPMCCWFLSFMAVRMCVTASICVTTTCVVCVCVPIQTNGGLGQRAWSSACPLIGIYILGESLISTSLIICLLSVSTSAGISVSSSSDASSFLFAALKVITNVVESEAA